jgi:hypothetical protein
LHHSESAHKCGVMRPLQHNRQSCWGFLEDTTYRAGCQIIAWLSEQRHIVAQ